MKLKDLKSKPQAKDKKERGNRIFREMTYEYDENEKIVLSEEGKMQITNLKQDYYRVTKIYLANLGDMDTWMMVLDETHDKNVRNPYLAHHFQPYEEKR